MSAWTLTIIIITYNVAINPRTNQYRGTSELRSFMGPRDQHRLIQANINPIQWSPSNMDTNSAN